MHELEQARVGCGIVPADEAAIEHVGAAANDGRSAVDVGMPPDLMFGHGEIFNLPEEQLLDEQHVRRLRVRAGNGRR